MLKKLDAAVMRVPRPPFRPAGIPALFLGVSLAVSLGGLRPASGQTEPKSAPSPVAPGDLSKPAFDTTTRVYDQVPSPDKAATTVVAEVEGRPITLGDVGDAIRALPPTVAQLPFDSLYPGILEMLIKQQALVVRAQQQGVDEDPVIHRRVKAAADRVLSEEYLRVVISRQITEAALLERYNRDFAGRPGPEEVRAQVILTSTEKEAAALIKEIQGGADFASVARRASKDSTASAGGELGFHTRDGMNPEVGAVAFTLPLGQVAPYPVHAPTGWLVVKAEERRLQPTPPFASVREQVRDSLLREGVEPTAAAALQGMTVRRYGLTGTEMKDDNPDAQ